MRQSLAVGPVKDTYEGSLAYEEEQPPDACTIVVETKGRAGRLSGRGAMHLEATDDAGTLVRYDGEFKVSGTVATVGQRLIAGVARKTIEQMLEKIGGRLTPPSVEAAETPRSPGTGAFWHPFSNPAEVAGHEIVITHARGSEIFDAEGRRYLDATASLWYCNVGYGRDEIAAAVDRQLRELPSYSTFGVYANAPGNSLADRISALSPLEEGKVFFTSGGSDAIDTAAKLARRYWSSLGQTAKTVIIGRRHAYHGMHAFGTSLAGIPANTEGFGTLVADVEHVEATDAESLAATIERLGADRVAAFIGEPVVGAGGVIPPPDGYWQRVQEICHEHDILLIADEVITGFGRVGRWFGCERYGFVPDLIVFAKGVTSGYLPLGGVVVGPRVAGRFWDGEGLVFRHGYTYSGHAAACAAGLANLDVLENERLVERVGELEAVFAAKAGALASHPLVAEVRSAGFLAGVELRPDVASRVEETVALARDHGILTRSLRGCTLQLSPAFTIEPEQLDEVVAGLERALDDLGSRTAEAR